jgi:hypothetical protein
LRIPSSGYVWFRLLPFSGVLIDAASMKFEDCFYFDLSFFDPVDFDQAREANTDSPFPLARITSSPSFKARAIPSSVGTCQYHQTAE